MFKHVDKLRLKLLQTHTHRRHRLNKPCPTDGLEKLRQKLHVLGGEQPSEGRQRKDTQDSDFYTSSGFPEHTKYFKDMCGEKPVWGFLVVRIFVLYLGGGEDEAKEEEEISKET